MVNIMSLFILCQRARGIRNHIVFQAKGDIFLVQGGCTLFLPKGIFFSLVKGIPFRANSCGR
jgi:hypothetical protein